MNCSEMYKIDEYEGGLCICKYTYKGKDINSGRYSYKKITLYGNGSVGEEMIESSVLFDQTVGLTENVQEALLFYLEKKKYQVHKILETHEGALAQTTIKDDYVADELMGIELKNNEKLLLKFKDGTSSETEVGLNRVKINSVTHYQAYVQIKVNNAGVNVQLACTDIIAKRIPK